MGLLVVLWMVVVVIISCSFSCGCGSVFSNCIL